MKRLTVLLLSIIIFAACGSGETSEDSNVFQEVGETTRDRLAVDYFVFEGEIPCIDCDKIDVELWLEKDSVQETSEYWIRTVHRNTHTGDITDEVEGIYTKLVGYRDNPTATVYQLNPGTNEPRYFLLNEDGTLSVLGPDRRLLSPEDDERYDYNLQIKREN